MPLINETFESLPELDPPLSPEQQSAITSSLLSDLPHSAATSLHPSLPPPPTFSFPPLIATEHARLAAGLPKTTSTGIDTSRYEALSPPQTTPAEDPDSWNRVLSAAAGSREYLASRGQNLQLLEAYGKNAWLISNWQLESVLGALERQLEKAKEEERQIDGDRKRAQEEVSGEMEILRETWKSGVGRVLEAEVAAEEMGRRVLEERRRAAVEGTRASADVEG